VFDADPFPILTSKKVNFQHVVEELLWFLKGETNSRILEEKGVNIWKKNSSKEFLEKNNLNYQEGDIGPMYGFQLVHFGEAYKGSSASYSGYNQIDYVVNLIKSDPTSRRIIMTTFNPEQAKEGVLYPCHGIVTQFYVEYDVLHLSTYQRSADVFLGLPWNISSYALLLHIIAHLTQKKVGKVIITLGDYHLYEEHYDKAAIQILRSRLGLYDFPKLNLKPFSTISELDSSYFELENYQSYKALVAEMKS
jgi:thymidylate synthase